MVGEAARGEWRSGAVPSPLGGDDTEEGPQIAGLCPFHPLRGHVTTGSLSVCLRGGHLASPPALLRHRCTCGVLPGPRSESSFRCSPPLIRGSQHRRISRAGMDQSPSPIHSFTTLPTTPTTPPPSPARPPPLINSPKNPPPSTPPPVVPALSRAFIHVPRRARKRAVKRKTETSDLVR